MVVVEHEDRHIWGLLDKTCHTNDHVGPVDIINLRELRSPKNTPTLLEVAVSGKGRTIHCTNDTQV